jgi:peptide/nickel transport system permease protein
VGRYILTRVAFALLVLVAISIFVFAAVRVLPGDVCSTVLGTAPTDPHQCDGINKELGLDEPGMVQYFRWAGGVLHGDWGKTLISRQDVWGQINERLPLTLEITILATIFALIVAVPIGVVSAMRQDRIEDYALRFFSIAWLSIPSFYIGTLLVIFPAKWWGYSTPSGYVDFWDDPLNNLEQLYLPAIALGLALSAGVARVLRSSMLEVLRQDFVRTARSKGLANRTIVLRHALRNALIPVLTLFALQFGVLFGGTVVLESIFNLPGLGTLTIESVNRRDFTMVQGIVLFFAAVLVTINLLVDISYAWVDPRIRYS